MRDARSAHRGRWSGEHLVDPGHHNLVAQVLGLATGLLCEKPRVPENLALLVEQHLSLRTKLVQFALALT